jgi:hypothetical protein
LGDSTQVLRPKTLELELQILWEAALRHRQTKAFSWHELPPEKKLQMQEQVDQMLQHQMSLLQFESAEMREKQQLWEA